MKKHDCATCSCDRAIGADAHAVNLFLSNAISKIEAHGEWVLTQGDLIFLHRAIVLVAQQQPVATVPLEPMYTCIRGCGWRGTSPRQLASGVPRCPTCGSAVSQ